MRFFGALEGALRRRLSQDTWLGKAENLDQLSFAREVEDRRDSEVEGLIRVDYSGREHLTRQVFTRTTDVVAEAEKRCRTVSAECYQPALKWHHSGRPACRACRVSLRSPHSQS